MELLATNQPWNLIFFMVIPVVLAETIAVTELYLLFTRNMQGTARRINKWAGILVGIYFIGIFIYLFKNAVVPLTAAGDWRGFADVIAVGSYLLGVIPLAGIALLELGFIHKDKDEMSKLKIHAIFVGMFLVVAHVAMIFGMLSPEVTGYVPKNIPQQTPQSHVMSDGSMMKGEMNMSVMMATMNTSLQGKRGSAFDKAFIDEMIVHHQGAIDMANLALENSKRKEIKDLASAIISAQTEEIRQMTQWKNIWFNR